MGKRIRSKAFSVSTRSWIRIHTLFPSTIGRNLSKSPHLHNKVEKMRSRRDSLRTRWLGRRFTVGVFGPFLNFKSRKRVGVVRGEQFGSPHPNLGFFISTFNTHSFHEANEVCCIFILFFTLGPAGSIDAIRNRLPFEMTNQIERDPNQDSKFMFSGPFPTMQIQHEGYANE